ncbi:MAG TPA: hypothetical protein VGJ26_02640, partial [Pirellulales bacterium]
VAEGGQKNRKGYDGEQEAEQGNRTETLVPSRRGGGLWRGFDWFWFFVAFGHCRVVRISI